MGIRTAMHFGVRRRRRRFGWVAHPKDGEHEDRVREGCRSMMHIRAFSAGDADAVVALWQRCDLVRSWNDPHKDIQRKLAVRPDLFLVGLLDGRIVATVMAGYEGHRGWLNYLAVDPDYQRRGLGRAIVARAEELLREAGCPKINLQIRSTNSGVIEFYRRIGYAVDEVVSMGKRLENDQTKVIGLTGDIE